MSEEVRMTSGPCGLPGEFFWRLDSLNGPSTAGMGAIFDADGTIDLDDYASWLSAARTTP